MEHYGNIEFKTKKELYKFLVENRDKLIAQKKAVKKEADCPVVVAPTLVFDKKTAAQKEQGVMIDPVSLNSLKAVCVINTTNFLDSHNDLHLPGIWNKSLLDNKMIMHIQEHNMAFDKIIADGVDLKAYTKNFTWAELGYSYKGNTEALVFESNIQRKRNEFMLNQYANGWVKNHSVGMYYVKMDFAINDEDLPNEYEAWKKYYPQIANPEVADERGYFWYVLEAKCVEGSAVPIGSNTATPTISTGKSITVCPDCGYEFDPSLVPSDTDENPICPNCGKPVLECNKPEKNKPLQSTYNKSKPDESTSIDYKFLLTNLKN
jgi:hypothetical protein